MNEIEQWSRVVAVELLRRGAVKINLKEPFRLTSGNFSPLYVNCRFLISSPPTMRLIAAVTSLRLELRGCRFDVVAGGETAGIPFAAFLACAMNKPMIYVRKAQKTHGIAVRVEGVIEPHSTVLLMEDLITDGGSKLHFVESIREVGGVVNDVVVVFDRLQGGADLLKRKGIELTALATVDHLLSAAANEQLVSGVDVEGVRDYLASPSQWHASRGLPFFDSGAEA